MDLARIFSHANPGTLVCGPGALGELPSLLREGKQLIVSDQGVAAAGILDQVTKVLESAGVPFAVFDQISPDAPLPEVLATVEAYRSQECQGLLAVGGGSPMDAAKAAGVALSHPGELVEYGSGRALEQALPPLVAVPTTSGTGSEVTASAVIGDPERTRKMIIRGPQLVPLAAVLDPRLLASMPPALAAETGGDALSHALEGLATRAAQPVSDTLVLGAIGLIGRYLRPMVGDPGNLEAAEHMLLASAMASMGWANVGLGLVHALAHPLGAHYHVSHGRACSLYLPVVMEFNALACAGKYRLAAEALGQDVRGLSDRDAAEVAVAAVEELLEDVGLPLSYDELGIDFELKEEMVTEVLGVPTRAANPRRSNEEQIAALFMAPER